MAQAKRSYVDAFLEVESRRNAKTRKTTRLELARARNKCDRALQNLQKQTERAQLAVEKLRECEASYDAAREDVERLKKELREEGMDVENNEG